jgi:thioredoxin 1
LLQSPEGDEWHAFPHVSDIRRMKVTRGIRSASIGVIATLVLMGILFSQGFFSGKESHATPLNDIPAKGMVTMVDLGADSCIPCKMMAPILVKLEKTYQGKAAIHFIDVWKHREQARRFGVRAIPTQIFYDEEGKEVYRHVGFMSEEAIVKQLAKMGVN